MLLADESFRDFFKCLHNNRSRGVATGTATVAINLYYHSSWKSQNLQLISNI